MHFSLFRKQSTCPTPAGTESLQELIAAGNDMAAHLAIRDGHDYSCVCGMIIAPIEDPSHHHNFCPVARFYSAAQCAKAVVKFPQPPHPKHFSPREDAAVFAILGTITVAMVAAILYFAQKAGL